VTDLSGRRLVHVAATGPGLSDPSGPTLAAAVAEGMEVVVVSAPGPFVAGLREQGIGHVPLRRVDPPGSATRRLLAGRGLVRLLAGLGPDIVHTHGPVPAPLGPVAARAATVPGVVHSVHGPLVDPHGPPGHRVLGYGIERLAAACSRFVLVEHPDDVALLRRLRVPADRIVLVGAGVDLERYRPRRSGADVARARAALGIGPYAPAVGVVGCPPDGEGPRALAAVATRLYDVRPEIVLVVLDAGAAGPWTAVAADCGNVVLAEGRVAEDGLHAGLDMVVAADRDRPSPSTLRALAGGLPAVATATPGGRQAVDDGVNGRVVPVGAVGALVDAVVELAGDPALRGTMGVRSRIRAEALWDGREVARSTLDVYRRLAVEPSTV